MFIIDNSNRVDEGGRGGGGGGQTQVYQIYDLGWARVKHSITSFYLQNPKQAASTE